MAEDRATQKIRMILVGGFLGAGKTTLLARSVENLVRRGRRVGLITNDQASDMVDTELLRQAGLNVGEVSGGCFCCGFNRLLYACDQLIEQHKPDVLIAEPVGSCADLSATVLQPLKKYCGDRFTLAPFSVLADPQRLREALEEQPGRLGEDVHYIFRKQLEEADLIVLNKADRVGGDEMERLKTLVRRHFPGREMMTLSALLGQGVEGWLDYCLQDRPSGQRIVGVDYERYAAGEAELGWLNALVKLFDISREGKPPIARPGGTEGVDWHAYALSLLSAVQDLCRERSAEIAHVKLFINHPGTEASLVGNLTDSAQMPSVRGQLASVPAVTMVLNARVDTPPEVLRQIIDAALARQAPLGVRHEITAIKNFAPARPNPTHRMDYVE